VTLINSGGKVCCKCFSLYEKCSKLLNVIPYDTKFWREKYLAK